MNIGILFLIVLIGASQCSMKKKVSSAELLTELSPLEAYGQEIYNRDNCARCHVMNVSEATKNRVSLDGFGEKYSNSWLYYYLSEPGMMNVNTEKYWNNKYTNFALITDVLERASQTHSAQWTWSDLITEADELRDDLQIDKIEVDRTEVLALIAYLQTIPRSRDLDIKDSLELIPIEKALREWREIVDDEESIIYRAARDSSNAEKGKVLFQSNCSPCHGKEGNGGVGPNHTDEYWLHGNSITAIAETITFGVPQKGMIGWNAMLSPQEIGELISYLRSIQGSNPEKPKPPQGEKRPDMK